MRDGAAGIETGVPAPTALAIGLGGIVSFSRTADKRIRIDLQEAGRRQILTRLHVINAADDEVAARAVDVEQVVTGGDLAEAIDDRAIDLADLRFW
jgi:hypothetical protein